MEILTLIIALARELPGLIDDIRGLNGADPTPEQLASFEARLNDSTVARNLEIEKAKARLAPPPAIEGE